MPNTSAPIEATKVINPTSTVRTPPPAYALTKRTIAEKRTVNVQMISSFHCRAHFVDGRDMHDKREPADEAYDGYKQCDREA